MAGALYLDFLFGGLGYTPGRKYQWILFNSGGDPLLLIGWIRGDQGYFSLQNFRGSGLFTGEFAQCLTGIGQ